MTVWCSLYFRQAFGIVDDFKSCISEIEFDDDTLVPVELIDPNVARIYSKSSRAKVNIFTLIKLSAFQLFDYQLAFSFDCSEDTMCYMYVAWTRRSRLL